MKNILNLAKYLLIVATMFIGINSSTNTVRAEEEIPPEEPPVVVLGCMDEAATNYNVEATEDDGSCIYPEDAETVSLTIRSGGTIIFEDGVELQEEGNITLNSHNIDARSVLSVVNDADLLDDSWSISDLQYYDSYGSFYLRCIESSAGEDCDNWQFAVNGSDTGEGMDQSTVSDGENIYLYFGPQYQISLSSNEITTEDDLVVTAQKYDYENDSWENRDGVTVGLTQPNPENEWSPLEIQTNPVDGDGQATFSAIPVGEYSVGIQEDYYFPTESLTVTQALENSGGGGGSSGSYAQSNLLKPSFDIAKAFEFIISQQKEDGSFGEGIYTDWTALAFSSTESHEDQKTKLIKYISANGTPGTMLTDYERYSMSLMSLGLSPYNTNGENYIAKITASFDGKQFGEILEDNDDIFALIVLQNAGFTSEEEMIKKTIEFILSKQKENGSWDESVDMTGASMMALDFVSDDEKVKNALEKAKTFLKENQKDTGGWANPSSTAWAIQGILALGENTNEWIKNTKNPIDYFAINQDTDGGMKNENLKNKLWETSYVLTSLSGKTWNELLINFEKQTVLLENKTVEAPKIVLKTASPSTPNPNPNIIKNTMLENLAAQNTATALEAIEDINEEPTDKNKSWLRRFFEWLF